MSTAEEPLSLGMSFIWLERSEECNTVVVLENSEEETSEGVHGDNFRTIHLCRSNLQLGALVDLTALDCRS